MEYDKSPFSLEQLRIFVVAAECGSFSAAARRLNKAQSAVSTALSNLEIDLGIELFDRSGKMPKLTAAGAALLRDAQRMLDYSNDLQERAEGLVAGEDVSLTIVVDDFIPPSYIVELLKEFENRFSHVELEILFAGLEDSVELIKSRRAHLGLMIPIDALEPDMRLESNQIGYMEFLPVVHPEHPLAAMKDIELSDLAAHRQLVSAARNVPRQLYVQWMLSGKLWRVDRHDGLYNLACAGLGWSMLPAHMVREDIATGRLVQLNLDLYVESLKLPFYLVKKRGFSGGTAYRWLVEEFLKRPMG